MSYIERVGKKGIEEKGELKRRAARAARDAYFMAMTFAILACWPGPGSLGQKLEASLAVGATFIGVYALIVFLVALFTETI